MNVTTMMIMKVVVVHSVDAQVVVDLFGVHSVAVHSAGVKAVVVHSVAVHSAGVKAVVVHLDAAQPVAVQLHQFQDMENVQNLLQNS